MTSGIVLVFSRIQQSNQNKAGFFRLITSILHG